MVLVAWPSLAVAKPTRVVIGPIAGDDDNSVAAAIKASISSDVTVVGKRETTKAEDKLKLSEELTDKEAKKLLKETQADAVIKGTLDSGDPMALHLKIYTKTAVKPKAFTLSFKDAASDRFRATLRKTILSKLGVVESADGADPAPEEPAEEPVKPKHPKKPPPDAGGEDGGTPPDEPAKPKHPKKPPPEAGDDGATGEGGETPLPKPKHPKKPKKPPEGEDGGEAGDGSDDDAKPASTAGRTANRDAVRVDFGPSLTARQLSFASRNFPQAPKPFKNGAVPGARVDGEFYPLAIGNPKSVAAGLGIAFDYDKTLSLTLRSVAADGTVVSAKANQSRFSFGPRFRIGFGQKATSPSLTLGVSYGVRSFVVDRGGLADPTLIDIPDIQYKGFQPGVGLRVPFTPSIAFVLDARAFLVTDAGPIQLANQYGQAKVTGGEGRAGLDIVIHERYAIQILGEFAAFGFAFTGNGTQTNSRDGDPSSPDVGGAADRYFGGVVTFGVLY